MTTTELINLINTISLRDKKNSIEQGRIMRDNPDNTYNVLITGSSGQLYKISPLNDSTTIYSVGDNVLVGYAFESNAIPNILGKSALELPEEEEVVVKEAAEDPVLFLTSGDADTNFYVYDGEGKEISSRGFNLGFANGAGVAFDGVYYYITDTYYNRVCKYDISGNLIVSNDLYSTYPWGITVNDDYVYVQYVVSYYTEVKKFDKDLNFLSSTVNYPLPRQICNDGIYLYGAYGGGIRKYTKEAVFVKTKSTGTNNIAIVTDRVGYIYYSEYGNGKPIRKMDTGLNSIVATSSETIDMSETMAIDGDGNIYVGNHVGLIKVFDTNLNYLRNFTINPTRGMCGNYLL